MKRLQELWKTRNGKITILVVAGMIFLVCCILPAVVPSKPAVPTVDPQIEMDKAWTTVAGTQAAMVTSTPVPTQTLAITNTPESTATPAFAKVGERVVQGDYILTVANVETAAAYGYSSAAAGNQYLAVELIIESNAATGVNVNPFYVTVKDSQGYSYQTAIFGKEPTLTSQNDLPKGELMRGWITFEIPQNATGLILTYEPITIFNNVRIRVALGR